MSPDCTAGGHRLGPAALAARHARLCGRVPRAPLRPCHPCRRPHLDPPRVFPGRARGAPAAECRDPPASGMAPGGRVDGGPVMYTVDEILIRAPLDAVFSAAADVERWPEILPHYRWVRMLERRPAGALVEMAAWRPFGAVRYPTWWVSEMETDPAGRTVRYRHVRGITTGMDVEWKIVAEGEDGAAARVTIVHRWDGPRWPLIRRPAAEWVIGPVFVHGIASRTLEGIRTHLEAQGRSAG